MAPRTRSNRNAHLEKQQLLASGCTFNTEGFSALPDDMHLEIISNFPSMPVPTQNRLTDSKTLRERHLTLFSLSQTCRSLRHVYRRYLWQRIEVFNGMETARGHLPLADTISRSQGKMGVKNKLYAEELLRQLEIVTVRDPSLAKHVNVLNVMVVEHSAEAILAELARCIALLPNLHTVQFNFRITILTYNTARQLFSASRYPRIRNVCLSQSAYFVLTSCPNVRCVMSYMNRPTVGFLGCVIRDCPEVEVLGSPLFALGTASRMVSRLQNLRDISVDSSFLQDHKENLKPLSLLPHLDTIRIRMDVDNYYLFKGSKVLRITAQRITDWVEWARNVMSSHETRATKRVIVVHWDGKMDNFPGS